MDMKIADPKGVWLRNMTAFRMHDPETNTYFEAGVATKAVHSTWAKGQPSIVEIDDPTAPVAIPEPTTTEAPKKK